MEAQELFRRLGAGARFDVRRFGLDARRFGVIKGKGGGVSLESLDFFGRKEEAPLGSAEEGWGLAGAGEEVKEDGAGKNNGEVAGKRKRTPESSKGKRKKKKTRASMPELSESNGIRWMSSLEAKFEDAKDKKPTAEKLERLRREKINRFRHQHKINIQGTDLPDPVATFDQLQKEYKVHPKIMENIQAAGFRVPTPIQMQAIPVMLHGRELLASAPTGSGKTLAFCIPLLTHLKQPRNKGFRALIISPTRELASQTHRELVRLAEGTGFRIHMIHKATEAAKKFGPKSSKKFDILVTTPNRLIYLLKQDPPAIDLTSVEWLVVDESDKLFEDGKSGFRDQLASIFLACTSHVVRRALFSATFARDVEEWCKLNLDSVVLVSVGARNSAADTVEQELLFVGSETGKLTAMRELVKKGFAPPVLVFVQSIERAKELFHELIYEGINVDVIHADKTQQQRDNVVRSFRAGKIWVLICSALLARGIDFKGVNMVINYDLPTSAVEYIHRIGRTGRAGHTGKAVTFFTEDDKPLLRSIANVIQRAGCPVPDYIKHFPKLQSKQKKKLIKKPLTRESICTTPQCFLKKDKRKTKTAKENIKEKKKVKEDKNGSKLQTVSES
ncbi:putative ATP-dependent RNA helicase DDX52 [Pterocles gutturalis]|uniref:Probable ATP-dependent RNA helicase DDX52 n=1 Tax=Pterocles gutturalis TaxID=240206 RepID=A0A093CBK6_9AVES|nr:PREDICTED: probable ATP-dependent RNA helicase DDX52 isoform X2 [Pterocles gutturalis]KFV13315.1 putative ATP-dependent RNA helicase DDX52 [Pterocles gutturalis]